MSASAPAFPARTVGPISFGATHPAIITPVTSTTVSDSVGQIDGILRSEQAHLVDVIEWRIDHLGSQTEVSSIVEAINRLKVHMTQHRLLVTLRTSEEGGECELTDDVYLEIINQLAPALSGHLIDVEYSRITAREAIYAAQSYEVVVVGSFHDFQKTPTAVQISAHLRAIVHAGADIAKVAVMPNSPEDVLEALEANLKAAQKLHRPCMVISMGSRGIASRLAGGVFGSCATFAAFGAVSAPGQLPLESVAQVLAASS